MSPSMVELTGHSAVVTPAALRVSPARVTGREVARELAAGIRAVPVIADAICAALSDRNRWGQMSHAGRAWAAEHGSWGASQKRVLDLYATLAARG